MKIGIIGAGNIGAVLARQYSATGHTVRLANSRGPETLQDLARETGATAVTAVEAARDADVVIVTIPEKNVLNLPKDLFDGVSGDVVVVDTGNYYPTRDGHLSEIENGLPDSQWVAQVLGRPVVKAFNNIYADSLANKGLPSGSPNRICLSVAGDDAQAKQVVQTLIDESGFDSLDAGSLADSWRQQPGTPAYCQDLDTDALKTALAAADRDEMPRYRAEADEAARKFFVTE